MLGTSVHIFTKGTDGHLLQFVKPPGNWEIWDISNAVGGKSIAGDPSVLMFGSAVHIFAIGR